MWLILAMTLCGTAPQASADAAKPTDIAVQVPVDPRVELFGIIFRLAGHPEYNTSPIKSYTTGVDNYFGPLRDHRVVKLAKSLRKRRGVTYDACMSLAVHITPDTFEARIPLEPRPKDLDERWPTKELPDFLAAVREFAAESKFTDFLHNPRPCALQNDRVAIERDGRAL